MHSLVPLYSPVISNYRFIKGRRQPPAGGLWGYFFFDIDSLICNIIICFFIFLFIFLFCFSMYSLCSQQLFFFDIDSLICVMRMSQILAIYTQHSPKNRIFDLHCVYSPLEILLCTAIKTLTLNFC